MDITTLGIDLAKSVFQLHGVDADGTVVLQKRLRRSAVLVFLAKLEPCLIALEACATSHYWARLGPRDCYSGPRSPADPARLREALCEAAEERYG